MDRLDLIEAFGEASKIDATPNDPNDWSDCYLMYPTVYGPVNRPGTTRVTDKISVTPVVR